MAGLTPGLAAGGGGGGRAAGGVGAAPRCLGVLALAGYATVVAAAWLLLGVVAVLDPAAGGCAALGLAGYALRLLATPGPDPGPAS